MKLNDYPDSKMRSLETHLPLLTVVNGKLDQYSPTENGGSEPTPAVGFDNQLRINHPSTSAHPPSQLIALTNFFKDALLIDNQSYL